MSTQIQMHAFQMIGHSWFGTVHTFFDQKTVMFELVGIYFLSFGKLQGDQHPIQGFIGSRTYT
jgi:hypothetical protein